MKTLFIYAISFLLGLTSLYGQGIDFVNKDFNEALLYAQKANKGLFVELYTQWCGPCKMLNNTIFKEKEVGDFFNENFISIKIDAETPAGLSFTKKYKASAYPTLMFFDADGQLLISHTGAPDKAGLIQLAQENANPLFMEVNNLTKEFRGGNMTHEQTKEYIKKLLEADISTDEAMKYLIKSSKRKELFSKDIYDLLILTAQSTDDYAFGFLVDNVKKYSKYQVGDKELEHILFSRFLFCSYEAERTGNLDEFFLLWGERSPVVEYVRRTSEIVGMSKNSDLCKEVIALTDKLLSDYPYALSGLGNELIKPASGVKGFSILEEYVSKLIIKYSTINTPVASVLAENYGYLYILNARDNIKAIEWYDRCEEWTDGKYTNSFGKINHEFLRKSLGIIPSSKFGQEAPEISLVDNMGKMLNLKSLRGNYVLLDFWATWCGPCKAAIPYLKEVNEMFADKKLVILGVSNDKDNELWRRTIKTEELNWLHVNAFGSDVLRNYEVNSIPRLILIDPQGRIISDNLQGSTLKYVITKTLVTVN